MKTTVEVIILSTFSIHEIEIYAHEQDLEVLMAEGDFGDKGLNHVLLGN